MKFAIFAPHMTVMTHLLCVVESPADVMAIEQSGSFRGKYHVLGGHLSPLDGIGPEEDWYSVFGSAFRRWQQLLK